MVYNISKISMKKILFLTFILLMFSISFANWYWSHSVSYSEWGITRCDWDGDCNYDSDWNITSCIGNDYPNIDFDANKAWYQYRDYAVDVNGDGKITSWDDYVSTSSHQITKSVSSNWSMTCFYWDWIPPDISKLQLALEWKSPWANILASWSAVLKFTYNDTNGGSNSTYSKITIYYELENKDSCSNWFLSESSIVLDTKNSIASKEITFDISKVYPNCDFSGWIWWREYSVKIVKICDEANNCITPNKIYTWKVYANTPIWYESTNFSDFDNSYVANNIQYFSWWILLKDQYWNPVLPSSWINRKVDIGITYNNDVYLNQYKATWVWWIRLMFKNNSYFTLNIWNSKTDTWSYYSLSDKSWYYWFNVKSYVPTYAGYDKAYWNIELIKLTYRINDDLWDNWSNYFSIDKKLKFKPQLWVKLKWIPPLASEGTYKKFNIETYSDSTNYNGYTFLLQFDPGNNTGLNTYLAVDSTSNWYKYSVYGYKNDDLISSFSVSPTASAIWNVNYSNLSSKDYYEKAILSTWWHLDSSNQWIISTHIAVKYSDWTIAIWNSDLVGANNYNYNSIKDKYLSENTVYINWLVSISDYKKVYNIFSGEKLYAAWSLTRPEVRARIYKLVSDKFEWYKFKIVSGKWNKIDIWDILPIFTYKWVKVYYYVWYPDNSTNKSAIIIPWKIGLSDRVLLILKNVDLFITWNIQTTPKGMFWIISLSSPKNPKWNIYLNNMVTNLDALIYTDKALITYKWDPTWTFKTQESLSQDDLKNQLYIHWLLWTFNTFGWSVRHYCPYFNLNCSSYKKYDLQYLRRFYLLKADIVDSASWSSTAYVPYWITTNVNDANDTLLIGWIKCELKDCNWDGKEEAYCKDLNFNLTNWYNRIWSSWVCNPFSLPEKERIKYFAPVVVDYDSRFKNRLYMPVFSDF